MPTAPEEPSSPTPPQPAPAPLSHNRDFMTLWTGQLASALGTSMSLLAFPLVAVALTGSTRFAGLVGGASALGAFLAGPISGGLADRVSRRRMIFAGNLLGAVLFASLAVAGLCHGLTRWRLLLVALLSGVASSIVSPALSAAVRSVVPPAQRAQSSAYASGRSNAVALAGPPAGGALVPLGFGFPFLADALSYLVAAVAVVRVTAPLEAPAREHRPFWREVGEGFTFLAGRPSLVAFCVRSSLFNLGVNLVSTATVLRLATAGVHSGRIGLVDTLAALGGLAGSMVAVKVVDHLPTGAFAIATAIVLSGLMAASVLSLTWWVVGALFGAVMFLMPSNNAGVVGYFSHIVPNGFQGRFYGATGMVVGVLSPLGPFLAGLLLPTLGGRATTWIGCALLLASCLPVLLVTELRTLPTPPVWSTWQEVGQGSPGVGHASG